MEVVFNPKVGVVTFRKVSEKGTPTFSMKLGEKFGGFHHFCALLDNSEVALHQ